MSRGQSPRSTETWKRASERYKSRETNDVIDVDSDEVPDVIIIDPPEPSEWTSPNTSTSERGTSPEYKNVICIDDDDNESGDSGSSKNGFEQGGNEDPYFMSGDESQTSSGSSYDHFAHTQSKKFQPAYNLGKKSASPKASKYQATFSRNTSPSNKQKFWPYSSSDSDDSDSDILEDSSGNIREEWEKASLRKKAGVNHTKSQYDFHEEASSMRNSAPKNTNADGVDEEPNTTSSSSANEVDEGPNTTSPTSANEVDEGPNTTSPTSANEVDEGPNTTSPTSANEVDEGPNTTSPTSANEVDEGPNTTSPTSANGKGGILSHEGVVHDMADKSNQDNQGDALEGIIQQDISDRIFCDTQGANQMPSGSIIEDREIIKKTDAYKRAQEEEWASRQRELQIQAEEARRLRKRRKAEAMRLAEMEKRQKQRLDEVREAQKKDEEILSLKEQLRVEVRRELYKLEANSMDMASLLRGLGITVDGGFYPFSSQVRVAYKKALLRFHPDRSSTSDLRQQIEAEEIFKLITRAKEKFML